MTGKCPNFRQLRAHYPIFPFSLNEFMSNIFILFPDLEEREPAFLPLGAALHFYSEIAEIA